MNQKRPKNLNLFTIHFPLPAIISILHRMTGVFLFLLIPLFIWILDYSLTESGFATIQQGISTTFFKLLILIIFIPFVIHLVAGIRHLVSDIGIGTSLKGGRLSAKITLILSLLLVIMAGIWLW